MVHPERELGMARQGTAGHGVAGRGGARRGKARQGNQKSILLEAGPRLVHPAILEDDGC